jgi:hypothetical protein
VSNRRSATHRGLTVEKFLTAGLGFSFLAVLAYAGLRDRPITDPGQQLILRVVAAVSAAACAAIIPGFIDVRFKGVVRAGGAIAVFVIIWFTNPPEMISRKHDPLGLVPKQGRFEFACQDIEDIPFGATATVLDAEQRIQAYAGSLTIMGADSLALVSKGQQITKSRVASALFEPINANPSAAMDSEPFSSTVSLRFDPGVTLHATACEAWLGSCVSVRIDGNWETKFSTPTFKASLNRYSMSAFGLSTANDAVVLSAKSAVTAFVELKGADKSSIVLSTRRDPSTLTLSDAVLSESTEL